jgi:hypothetical protein
MNSNPLKELEFSKATMRAWSGFGITFSKLERDERNHNG